MIHVLSLVWLEIGASNSIYGVSHRKCQESRISSTLSPSRHKPIDEHRSSNAHTNTEKPCYLEMRFSSRARTERNSQASSFDPFTGHSTERQLSNTYEPSKSIEIVNCRWERQTSKSDTTPKAGLSLDLLFVGLDD